MNIGNNTGQRMEPWRTPCLTNPHQEKVDLEYLISVTIILYLLFR